MVDPISATIGAVAAALVAKAADRAAEEAVDEGASALQRLVARVRDRFARRHVDDNRAEALERVQDAPDSPSRLQALAEVIDAEVAEDPGFGSELAALVAEARREGADVGAITQIAVGDQNVQVGGVTQSRVDVNYGRPARGRDAD